MNNYQKIDLDKIIKQVTEYCSIAEAKESLFNEQVDFNPLVIKNKLKQTKEALELLNKSFNLSFDGIENLNDLFIKASKDINLNGIELAKVLSFHYHCVRIKTKLDGVVDDLSIKDYSDAINVHHDLAKHIEKIIDPSGNIKSDASPKLKEIFNKIERNSNDLNKTAETFIKQHQNSLQETNVFMRNDRVSFLLKNADKNKFKGYQYGTSSSGLATYVEPEIFIDLNNKKATYENEKLDEVNRLLKELTYDVSRYAYDYQQNFVSLIKLDVIFAKAEFGFYKAGIIADISNDNLLYLKDIAHPLIDEKAVVVNTYSLTNNYQGIVISGTNTGGKTVGLKLIGLSVLMAYLGIPLLASQAKVPLFNAVYIDMDDNQSINNALSTFSAHISNINSILNKADENSLILIDELISGTDPKEAQAISLAILQKILQIKSKFIITTHYDDIKQFAYQNDAIMLSSVGFDLDNLKPTYKYQENSIGVSNAIDIASRYFDDQEIIANARNFLKTNKSKEDQLLDKLALEIKEKEQINKQLLEETKLNNELNQQLTKQINDFNNEKELLKKQYIHELNEYIEEIKNEAYKKIASISPTNKSTKVIDNLNELKIEDVPQKEESFQIGDHVRIGDSAQIGEIVDLDDKKVSINIKGMIVKTNIDQLTKINKTIKKEYHPKARMKRVSAEINLVGERVEDALVILGNYLDQAYGSGLSSCKIIHGFGTGQLRKGIREYLAKARIVREFSNGDAYDGGSNVTIVKFK